jgi:hypothetical protein
MGHPRRAEAAPSPVQLLAIFQAKESGVPLPEISRRTKYAVSSIIRWWEKWGKDTAFFEAVSCEIPDLAKEHSFDALFPDAERQGTFDLGGPVEISKHFSGGDALSAQIEDLALTPLATVHPGLAGDEWDE